MKITKVEKLKVSTLEKMGWWCAWAGCSEICEGELHAEWVTCSRGGHHGPSRS